MGSPHNSRTLEQGNRYRDDQGPPLRSNHRFHPGLVIQLIVHMRSMRQEKLQPGFPPSSLPDTSRQDVCVEGLEPHVPTASVGYWNEQSAHTAQEAGPQRSGRCLSDLPRTMEKLAADLALVTAERRRLQKRADKQRARRRERREHALQVATIAFCHEPTAGATIAAATLRKYPRYMENDLEACTREIEERFLETPVDELCQWLDWTGGVSHATLAEAQRVVEDTRLLSWVGAQNSA